jgi:hypothetical protein
MARFEVSTFRVDGLDHAPGGVSEVPPLATAGHFDRHKISVPRVKGGSGEVRAGEDIAAR